MSFVGYRLHRLSPNNCTSIDDAIYMLQEWRKNQSKYYKDSKSSILKYCICPNCKLSGKLNGSLICKKCKKSMANQCNIKTIQDNYLFNNINEYPYTPNIFTKNRGRQCFPKTIKIHTPKFLFVPPKTKHKNGLPIVTVPDPIFLNVKMAVSICNFLKLLKNPQYAKSVNENYDIQSKKVLKNYTEFDAEYAKKISRYYVKIYTYPLNYFSLEKQWQGKNNIFRSWNISKRVVNAGRATIIPNLDDEIDVLRVPYRMWIDLGKPACGLVKRDPSISEEAFAFVNILPWKRTAMGISPEYLENLGGDFDGDEMLVTPLEDLSAIYEAKLLCSVRENILSHSSSNGMKLTPCNDAIFFFFYCTFFKVECNEFKKCFPKDFFYVDETFKFDTMEITKEFKSKTTLNKMLVTVANVYSSLECVKCFQKIRAFVNHMHDRYAYSVNIEELVYFKSVAKGMSIIDFIKWFDTKYVPKKNNYFGLLIKAGIKLTTAHLYQIIGQDFGGEKTFHIIKEEKFKNTVTGNFMDGLSEMSYIHHCQTSIDNYVSSRWIGKIGYEDNKIKYCLQNLEIDNLYRLVQGDKVLFEDVTDYIPVNEILPAETFSTLCRMHSCSSSPPKSSS